MEDTLLVTVPTKTGLDQLCLLNKTAQLNVLIDLNELLYLNNLIICILVPYRDSCWLCLIKEDQR